MYFLIQDTAFELEENFLFWDLNYIFKVLRLHWLNIGLKSKFIRLVKDVLTLRNCKSGILAIATK